MNPSLSSPGALSPAPTRVRRRSGRLGARLLRIGFTGVSLSVVYLGAAWFSFAYVPWLRFLTRGKPEAVRERRIQDLQFRSIRWTLRLIQRFRLVHYSIPDPPAEYRRDRPCVVVANHPSLLDVLVVKASLPGVTCVVKPSVFYFPLTHGFLSHSGDFPGPRDGEQRVGATSVLDNFVARLGSGRSVLVFPEGTRSPDGGLRKFHRGAAEAALRAGVQILPVLIRCDPPLLTKSMHWTDVPESQPRFEISYLPMIDVAGRSSREVTAGLEALYSRALSSDSRTGK